MERDTTLEIKLPLPPDVTEGGQGVNENHSRPHVAHHGPDLLAIVRGIAMNSTLPATFLDRHLSASIEAFSHIVC